MNFITVAAQDPDFGPVARIPETDRLIGGRGDQVPPVPGEHQLANPGRVPIQPYKEPASLGIPDANGGVFKSRPRSQHSSVRRNGQSGQAKVPLKLGLPKFFGSGEVNALDAVAVV